MTHLYVYLIFSFCDGIPGRSHGRRSGWLTSLHTLREESSALRMEARLREREVSGLTLPSQRQRGPSVKLTSSFLVSLGPQSTAWCVITISIFLPLVGVFVKSSKPHPDVSYFESTPSQDDTDNYHHAFPWLVSACRSHTTG